jgi:hypothetical protein
MYIEYTPLAFNRNTLAGKQMSLHSGGKFGALNAESPSFANHAVPRQGRVGWQGAEGKTNRAGSVRCEQVGCNAAIRGYAAGRNLRHYPINSLKERASILPLRTHDTHIVTRVAGEKTKREN